jgi:hypothetical protein
MQHFPPLSLQGMSLSHRNNCLLLLFMHMASMVIDCQFNYGVRSMAGAANIDKRCYSLWVVGDMFVCKLQTYIIAVYQTVEAVFNRPRVIYVFLMF